MNQSEIIEELIVAIEGASNMMRGMQLDQNIHAEAKLAMSNKINELDELAEKYA